MPEACRSWSPSKPHSAVRSTKVPSSLIQTWLRETVPAPESSEIDMPDVCRKSRSPSLSMSSQIKDSGRPLPDVMPRSTGVNP